MRIAAPTSNRLAKLASVRRDNFALALAAGLDRAMFLETAERAYDYWAKVAQRMQQDN